MYSVITRKLIKRKTTLQSNTGSVFDVTKKIVFIFTKSPITLNASEYTAILLCPMLIGLFKVIT